MADTLPVSPPAPPTNAAMQRIGLAMFPFTPVPLSGEGMLLGWGRLAIYGGLAYVTWAKHRKFSYALAGAAAVSAIASISGKAWNSGGTA